MADTLVGTTGAVATTKTTYFRWIILALIFMIFTFATADRATIGFAMPYIRKEFAMSNTEAGAIMSFFFFGYAFCLIPGGILVAKLGVRKVYRVLFFVYAACCAAIGFAPSPLWIKVLRGALGMAQGGIAIGLSTTINNWFPTREKGTATGIFIASSKFGPLAVPAICALIISFWGWREIFFVFATPWIIALIMWMLTVKDKPTTNALCSQSEIDYIESGKAPATGSATSQKTKEFKHAWVDRLIMARKVERITSVKGLLGSWNLFGSAIGYMMLACILSVCMNWIPTYLVKERGFAIMGTAIVASAPFFGTVIGNLVGGWLSDFVFGGRRKPMMLIASATSIFTAYSLTLAPANPVVLGLLLFLVGFMLGLGYSSYVVYVMGLTTKDMFPICTSVQNSIGQFGAAMTPITVGFLLDKYNWDVVFVALAACATLGLIMTASVKEPVENPLV